MTVIIPVLVLGNGRYLTIDGAIVPAEVTFTEADIEFEKSLSSSFDPELEAAPGSATRLTDKNRASWELSAAKGGHKLADLLA
ncbi:hypothetical protein CH267_02100 [Rhodococcus sp. 06-621-2]|nr:hypothetical protein CH267_02100 [Rhodococcus sp. 06-621-2]